MLIIESKFNIRILRVICENFGNSIPMKPSCSIKTIKRQKFISIRLNLTRKVSIATLNYWVFHKNSDGYKKIFEREDFQICKVIKTINTEKVDIFISLMSPLLTNVYNFVKSNANGNIFFRRNFPKQYDFFKFYCIEFLTCW